jgi:hypothetical protein
MPFTFSHPAAVLPLGRLGRKWLSLTGLVIGSMTPDFEYFIRMRILSKYSHSWMGLFWYDLPLGLVLVFIYNTLVKDNLIDHLPAFLNKRLSVYKNTADGHRWYYIIVLIVSVLIGAATHILWDSFTHPMGYFVLHVHKLKHQVHIANHSFRFYNVLQQFSSLVGAVIIAVTVFSLPAHQLTRVKNIAYYWLMIVMIAILVLMLRMMAGLSWQQYGDVIVTTISGALIGLIVASVLSPLLKV